MHIIFGHEELKEAEELFKTKNRHKIRDLLDAHLRSEEEMMARLKEIAELSEQYKHRIQSASKFVINYSLDKEENTKMAQHEIAEAMRIEQSIIVKIRETEKFIREMK